MSKAVVLLKGGLGNQMFQYAFARSISIETSSELLIDNWSGFVSDYKYHRKYELDNFPIVSHFASLRERLPFWPNQLIYKLFPDSLRIYRKDMYGLMINEVVPKYIPNITEIIKNNGTNIFWLNGNWQSPLYFDRHSESILNELTPPQPIEKRFIELGKLLRESESVALGIRLYEESKNPEIHTSDGRLKDVFQINKVILRLRELRDKARFFIFCTHRSPLLEQLSLPKNTVFVTHDDGYLGTLERMWLLTQCKHHIFTNSTFYWWGAWLSQKFYNQQSQTVFAADNFTNSDAIPKKWNIF